MVDRKKQQLNRNDWLLAALDMCVGGIDTIKVAPLAADIGVTTGSFYWHFKNRGELLNALLEFWEQEMTDSAIASAKTYSGLPAERIFSLMKNFMENRLARYDLAVWHWAQSDGRAKQVFGRAIKKRFAFAARLFVEAGFSKRQAEARGRMMVLYMMSELTLTPNHLAWHEAQLREKHKILLARPGGPNERRGSAT